MRKYSGDDWRRVGVGRDELKRFASKDLSPVVRELWGDGYSGHDTRELLLELIYLTPLIDCTDLALGASLDEMLPDAHRLYGVWSVAENGGESQRETLAYNLKANVWPSDVLINILSLIHI